MSIFVRILCFTDVKGYFLFHRNLYFRRQDLTCTISILIGVIADKYGIWNVMGFTDKILVCSFKAVHVPTCLLHTVAPRVCSAIVTCQAVAFPVCHLGGGCLFARIIYTVLRMAWFRLQHCTFLYLQYSSDSFLLLLTIFLTKARIILHLTPLPQIGLIVWKHSPSLSSFLLKLESYR